MARLSIEHSMHLRILMALSLVVCSVANASLPLKASLHDLACGAHHIFVGRVVGVDMVDENGRRVQNDAARTGPGLKNRIRLQVEVLEVIESTESRLPEVIMVPLDPFMHYSLGQIKAAHAGPSAPRLVFLRGAKYEPIIPGRFFWPIEARDEALALRKKCKLRDSP